jgi:hypothetical protein
MLFNSRSAVAAILVSAVACVVAAQAASVSATQKKFGIKSAIVVMDMKMSTQMPENAPPVPGLASTGIVTQAFDDFGAQTSFLQEVAMDMMGMHITTHKQTILKKDSVIQVDLDKKEAIRSRLMTYDDPGKLDFANMSEDLKKKWNIQKSGTEVVAGKACDVYTFQTDDVAAAAGQKRSAGQKISMTGKCSVWNNIGLKSDFLMNGSMHIQMTATKVAADAAVPASTFDVPTGFAVKEMKE